MRMNNISVSSKHSNIVVHGPATIINNYASVPPEEDEDNGQPRIRLMFAPDENQSKRLRATLKACHKAFNWALLEIEGLNNRTGECMEQSTLSWLITGLRKHERWMTEVDSVAFRNSAYRALRMYERYVRTGKKRPSLAKIGDIDWFTTSRVRHESGKVFVPKVKWMPVVNGRYPSGNIALLPVDLERRSVTIRPCKGSTLWMLSVRG